MATVEKLSASMRLLPLLKRTVSLRTVVFTAPDVALARLADGQNNWTFTPHHAKPDTDNPWNVALDQLQVHKAELAFADGRQKLALRVQADTLDGPAAQPSAPANADSSGKADSADDSRTVEAKNEDGAVVKAPGSAQRYGVQFQLRGRFAEADIEGQGKAGDLRTPRTKGIDYPVQFSARAGDTEAQVEGILANPLALEGMDSETAYALAGHGVRTVEDLGELGADEVAEFGIDRLDEARAATLILAARAEEIARLAREDQ